MNAERLPAVPEEVQGKVSDASLYSTEPTSPRSSLPLSYQETCPANSQVELTGAPCRSEDETGYPRKQSAEKKSMYTDIPEHHGTAELPATQTGSIASSGLEAAEAVAMEEGEQECWIATEDVCPWEDE